MSQKNTLLTIICKHNMLSLTMQLREIFTFLFSKYANVDEYLSFMTIGYKFEPNKVS